MSVVSKTANEQVFDEALRDAECWTYRSSVGFDTGESVVTVRKAYRLGDVRDVFIERDKFDSSILEMYRGVKQGTVSRIVAGTGAGKSTKMPIALALALECVSFVVCPTYAMAGSLVDYVQGFVVGTKYESCKVELVKNYTMFVQLAKPAVAYMGASEFLAMLAMHQELFRERSVGFVYLDESHERIPAYAVCRLLVSLGFFKDTKVFMGSATASNQNMEARLGGVKQVIKAVKPAYMQYDDVSQMSSKSPFSHMNLALRTLIFLPSEKNFAMLEGYYESNAVHVRTLKYTARHSEIRKLNEFLESVTFTVVVLATPAHQTGYTFAVDAVIDCGVTPYLHIDVNNGDIEKRERIVTEFERVQRSGRVGRYIDGTAYQVDAEPEDEGFELYAGSEIYVVLWCKVFYIDVSIAYLRKWTIMLQELSVVCAKNLLCSRLHPALLLHYMDSDGRAYAGTRHIFSKLLGRTEAVMSGNKKLSDEVMSSWVTKVLSSDVVGNLAGEFKAPCQMPVDWLPIACVMYNALNGVSVNSFFSDGRVQRRDLSGVSDTGSVVSYALSASSVGSAGSGGFLEPGSRGRYEGTHLSGNVTPADSISMVGVLPSRMPNIPELGGRAVSKSSTGSGRTESIKSGRGPGAFRRPSSSGSSASRDFVYDREQIDGDSLRPRSGDVSRGSSVSSGGSRNSRRDARGSVGSFSTVVVDGSKVNDAVTNAVDKELKKVTVAFSNLRRDSMPSVAPSESVVPVAGGTARVTVAVAKVHIRPSKLVSERIRPYKDSLMDRFQALRVSRSYGVPYGKLVDRGLVIANMPKEIMVDHFLASVLSWNTLVSEFFHFRAVPHTGLLADMRNRRGVERFAADIAICRGILEVFYYHGLKLALYQGVEQSGLPEVTDELLRAQSIGEYSQRVTNRAAADAVERVKYCVRMSNEYGGVSGHYFVDGNIMMLVKHVFNEVDGDGTYMIFPRTDVASVRMLEDQRVYKCRLTSNSLVKLRYRLPRIGEAVFVVAFLQRDLPDVFGVFTIIAVGSSGVYDAKLSDGMSGAPLVSLVDGCVIGLHHGRFMDGEHKDRSEFVTVV